MTKNSALGEVVEKLKTEEKRIQDELREATARVSELQEALARVHAGLVALSGKPAVAGKGMSTEDVEGVIASELSGGKTMTEPELKTVVIARAQEAGRSGRGAAVSLKRALASKRFVKAGHGYRLA